MEVRFDSSGREIKSNKAWREECESLRQQLATVTAERDELAEALKQFAECDLNDGNCASLEVAARRIRSLAQAALSKARR